MHAKKQLDACGAFMQRPPGRTFQDWVDTCMRKEYISIAKSPKIYIKENQDYSDSEAEMDSMYLAYNSYTGGTGVLIRTRIFHENGLLFDRYPCLLGDWTTYQRILFKSKGNNIAWCSGTTVKLLNIKEDGVSLNDDFPEYDKMLKDERDRGNEWFTKIGSVDGVERFVEENGGREKL